MENLLSRDELVYLYLERCGAFQLGTVKIAQ